MRWVVGIMVVVVLCVLGYQIFGPESAPPVAGGVVQSVAPAGETASQATERTRAIAEQAASEAQQVAADAARRMQATAERVARAAQDVASSRTALEVGDTDLGKGLTEAVDGVATALGGITDQASAQAAVPKLVAIDARLDQLGPKIEQLQDDARKTLASLVTGLLPQIQSALDRVQATPGAGGVVEPALDPIIAKLDDWSHEPA